MYGRHPELDDAADLDPETEALASGYRLVADLFVYPAEVDREKLITAGRERVVPALAEHVDTTAADRLDAFLDGYEDLTVDEYVRAHELEPECPLYLGHYEFDEPETCREIADADRNQYMVELNGIYEHYGFELEDELADFLPAMVEFCWLTLPERGDSLRTDFVSKMATMLPGMRDQFDQAETPYRHLLAALERLLEGDVPAVADDEASATEEDAPGEGEESDATDAAPEPGEPAPANRTASSTGGED